MILGIGFPASVQKFHEEAYLDAVCAGSNGIEAKSPPSAKLPLLNHRSVTTIESTRNRTASTARECKDARSINVLIGVIFYRLTKGVLKGGRVRNIIQLLFVHLVAFSEPRWLNISCH